MPFFAHRFRDRAYLFDPLGSTDRLVGASQTVTDSYIYQAFGKIVLASGSTTNRWRFKGARSYYDLAESGIILALRRAYAPSNGRWLSPAMHRSGQFTTPFDIVRQYLYHATGALASLPAAIFMLASAFLTNEKEEEELPDDEKEIWKKNPACISKVIEKGKQKGKYKESCAVTSIDELPKGTRAWIECDGKGGFKVAYASKDRNPDSVKSIDELRNCDLLECVEMHEQHHIKQFKFLCPKVCQPDCAPPVKAGQIVGFKDKICSSLSECLAYVVHLKCLYRQRDKLRKEGKSQECMNLAQREIQKFVDLWTIGDYPCDKAHNVEMPMDTGDTDNKAEE